MLNDNYICDKEEDIKYFKEELITKIIQIPIEKPDIKKILNIDIWPIVEKIEIVESEKGISNEGQKLTGIKLFVEIKISGKITYVVEDIYNSSNILKIEDIQSVYIILPEVVKGKKVKDLIRSNRINITPHVEDYISRKINNRVIQKSTLLLVNAVVF